MEWKYKFQAFMAPMGLQSTEHDRFMKESERATTRITDAGTLEEATTWKQLSQEMKYILTSGTSGGAATVCRQNQHETGYEIYRQLNNRYSIPVGTRSMGYVTKLLKPTLEPNNFEESNFEESFSHSEFELTRFEKDNNTNQ